MKKMLIALCAALAAIAASAYDFGDEALNYKVMYKWGLVNKTAGTVNISLRATPDSYSALLTAKSASWADSFYKLRDTLTCEIDREGFRPTLYVKKAHEGNQYEHCVVAYRRQGATTIGDCSRYRERDGKVRIDETRTLEAMGTTLDMFSAFYYMRGLPYEDWEPGRVTTASIFSGRRCELLTLKYRGLETIEYDGRSQQCYKVTFTFTSQDKEKPSDDMQAWIAVDSRIPLKLEGKLPVGGIKCYYQP